jgi:hypothetical protein
MIWKIKHSNFIIAIILTIVYTVTTLLNIIGPLHMNATGGMNEPGKLAAASVLYFFIAVTFTWVVYFLLRDKPKVLFFTLVISALCIIIFDNYLWSVWGSS